MTARVEAERAIVDTLEAHFRQGQRCKCGEPIDGSYGLGAHNHRAHVASVLADLMADGLADAWDEGHLDVCNGCVCPTDRNPYREADQ